MKPDFPQIYTVKGQEAASISMAMKTIPAECKGRIFSTGQAPRDDFQNMTEQNTVQLCLMLKLELIRAEGWTMEDMQRSLTA